MSGGKGGSTTSQVKIPKYIEDAARQNLGRADYVSSLGYTPYYGPDVAAQTPLTQAGLGNLGAAASAYGLGTVAPDAGMPKATEYAGGVRGYSSAPLYEQSLAELQARAPGQYDAMRGMFIDPVTGAQPQSPFGYDPNRYAAQTNQGLLSTILAPTFTGGAGDDPFEQQQREQAQQDWQDKYGNSGGWDPVGDFVDRISPGFSSKDW